MPVDASDLDRDESAKSAMREALERFLPALIRMLLRCGITHGEFTDLTERIYVAEAGKLFGVGDKLANVSKTAVLTGIRRKRVSEIREQRTDRESAGSQTRKGIKGIGALTRVLQKWHLDAPFAVASSPDADGHKTPVLLPVQSDTGEPSFESLVKECTNDVPYSTVLKELLRVDAISRTPDGRLEALKRDYEPAGITTIQLDRLGVVLNHMLAALERNIFLTIHPKFRESRAHVFVARESLAECRAIARKAIDKFLQDLDALLAPFGVDLDSTDATHFDVGAGASK